jgi:hypothetical protein
MATGWTAGVCVVTRRLISVQTGSGAHPDSYLTGTGGNFAVTRAAVVSN